MDNPYPILADKKLGLGLMLVIFCPSTKLTNMSSVFGRGYFSSLINCHFLVSSNPWWYVCFRNHHNRSCQETASVFLKKTPNSTNFLNSISTGSLMVPSTLHAFASNLVLKLFHRFTVKLKKSTHSNLKACISSKAIPKHLSFLPVYFFESQPLPNRHSVLQRWTTVTCLIFACDIKQELIINFLLWF